MRDGQVHSKLVRVVRSLPISTRYELARAICAEFGWDVDQFMDAVKMEQAVRA